MRSCAPVLTRGLILGLLLSLVVGLGACGRGPEEPSGAPGRDLPSSVTDAAAQTSAPSPTPTQTPSPSPAPTPSLSPAQTPSPSPAHSPPPCPSSDAIASAEWTHAEGGRSLAVTPAQSLRECAGPWVRVLGQPAGWAEVVALAGEEADSAAMRQQYLCHLRFAPAKATWNLEPWRPEVDARTLLRTRCNP